PLAFSSVRGASMLRWPLRFAMIPRRRQRDFGVVPVPSYYRFAPKLRLPSKSINGRQKDCPCLLPWRATVRDVVAFPLLPFLVAPCAQMELPTPPVALTPRWRSDEPRIVCRQ